MIRMIPLCALALAATACGSDAAPLPFGTPGTNPGLFPGLSGEFLIEDDCVLSLNGSSGDIDCNSAGSDAWGTWRTEYDMNLRIGETEITFSGSYAERYDDPDGNLEETYVESVDVTATRLQGRDSEGRFSALAGDWAGTIEYRDEWVEYYESPPETYVDTSTINFSSSVSGDAVSVSWTSESDSGAFVIRAVSGGIDVDGDFVEEL